LLLTRNSAAEFKKLSQFSLRKPLIFLIVFALLVDIMQMVEILIAIKDASSMQELRALSPNRNINNRIYPPWLFYTIFITHKVSILPIFIILLKNKSKKTLHPTLCLLSFLIALYPLFNFLLFSKRGFAFFTLVTYLWYFFYFQLWKNKVFIFITMLLLSAIFIISSLSFQKRESARNISLYASVNLKHSYGKFVPPSIEFNQKIKKYLQEGAIVKANTYLYLLNFSQYYVHGFFEYFHLYDYRHKNNAPNGYGIYTLAPAYKILSLSGIIDEKNYTETDILGVKKPENYRKKARLIDKRSLYFDTFYGSLIKDWGKYAKYYILLFGFVFAFCFRLAQINIFAFPLYAVLSTIVYMFPMTNALYNGGGWHFIILTVLFYASMRLYSTRVNSKYILSS